MLYWIEFKLNHGVFKYDLRKYFFTNRIVNLWNDLLDYVVMAANINTFKGRLDKYWANQEILYNWESEFSTGTGVSRSIDIDWIFVLIGYEHRGFACVRHLRWLDLTWLGSRKNSRCLLIWPNRISLHPNPWQPWQGSQLSWMSWHFNVVLKFWFEKYLDWNLVFRI